MRALTLQPPVPISTSMIAPAPIVPAVERRVTASGNFGGGNRIVELDALRGLAAVAVMLFHYTTRYDQLFGRAEPLRFEVLWGHYGVELFFMLSGFVIFMTLERTTSAASFVVNRFSRLYPVYWAAIGLTFAIVSWASLPGQETTIGETLLNATMVPELLHVRFVDGAYWSLQVELFFYAGMLILSRSGALKKLPWVVMVWLLLAVIVHSPAVQALGPAWLLPVWPKLGTLLCLEYAHLFAIGMLLYKSRGFERMPTSYALLLAACIFWRGMLDDWTSAGIILGLAILLKAAIDGRLPLLRSRGLVFLGTISYSFYLIHQNVGYVVIRLLTDWADPHVCVLAAAATALLLATGLTFLVERPSARALKAWDRRHRSWASAMPAPRHAEQSAAV
jgi:peptidoglycan/LPS O-acetylase OafA/YrhL